MHFLNEYLQLANDNKWKYRIYAGKLKVDARNKRRKMHRCIVSRRCRWNATYLKYFFSDWVSTTAEDISKMKNSSKSNFRQPPHCGCEANAPLRYFDMHFVFTEIESNAIARHYSSPLSQSSPRCRSRKRIFLFFPVIVCTYTRVCINSAIAPFNLARVAKMLRDTRLK